MALVFKPSTGLMDGGGDGGEVHVATPDASTTCSPESCMPEDNVILSPGNCSEYKKTSPASDTPTSSKKVSKLKNSLSSASVNCSNHPSGKSSNSVVEEPGRVSKCCCSSIVVGGDLSRKPLGSKKTFLILSDPLLGKHPHGIRYYPNRHVIDG